MHYKKSFGEKISTAIIYMIIIILTLAFLYPVIYCLSMSLSDPDILGGQPIGLLPKGFSLEAYRYLLSSSKVFRYYGNTILYAGVGTLISILVTSLVAYALSISTFTGRKASVQLQRFSVQPDPSNHSMGHCRLPMPHGTGQFLRGR